MKVRLKRRKLVLLLVSLAAGVAILAVACALGPWSPAIGPRFPRPLAFVHVTVIDCTGAAPQPDMTVVVADGRIAAVGKIVPIPANAQVVDGSGKFLIPGLWDMHAHCEYEGRPGRFLPLFLAHGVTGIRDMGGVLQDLSRLRREIEEGKRIGPRMVISGETVDGPIDKTLPHAERLRLFAASAAEGRACVRLLKQRGSDGVKVYSGLDSEAYFAIAEEAKKEGLAFWGHVPEVVRVADASDAGQRSLEHLQDIMRACSTLEEQMKEEARQVLPQGLDAALLVLDVQFQRAPVTYSEEKADALFARLKKNDTWVCPTMLACQSGTENGPLTDAASMRFLAPGAREGANRLRAARSPQDMATWAAIFQRGQQMVLQIQKSGVGLLAGTDTPAAIPGYCLHDELSLLVGAGLSPMEALQTATRNPARFLGKEQDVGTVKAGKVADLVLLRGDPLADIRNTKTIDAVVRDGHLLDRAALDKMLADAEAVTLKK
jgi:imidazolonepropionase-like amidohydrolase